MKVLYYTLYLLIFDGFLLGLVFRITHSVYIQLLLLSEMDLAGLLNPPLFNIVGDIVIASFCSDYVIDLTYL